MTDTGQPPKKAFEPPPWEKEQFEELARRREGEAKADAAIDELAALSDPYTAPEPEPADDEIEEEAAAVAVAEGERPAPAGPPGVDERRVAAMLLQLSGEETPTMAPIRRASRVIAAIVALVGVAVTVVAGLVGTRAAGSGPLAATSSGVGVVIGVALIGVAVWLWLRANE